MSLVYRKTLDIFILYPSTLINLLISTSSFICLLRINSSLLVFNSFFVDSIRFSISRHLKKKFTSFPIYMHSNLHTTHLYLTTISVLMPDLEVGLKLRSKTPETFQNQRLCLLLWLMARIPKGLRGWIIFLLSFTKLGLTMQMFSCLVDGRAIYLQSAIVIITLWNLYVHFDCIFDYTLLKGKWLLSN